MSAAGFVSRWAAIVALAITAACASPGGAASPSASVGCSLPSPTNEITIESPVAGERHLVLDLVDGPALWAEAPRFEDVARFRDGVSARLAGAVGWRALAERQSRVFAAGDDSMKREARNAQLVLDGKVGRASPAGCLEVLLLREQMKRYPMLEHPTEMGAFVLRREGTVRVYLSGSDRVGQKMRSEVTSRIAADLASGYRLAFHLHNHPFLFDRVIGDRMWTTPATLADVAGGIVPSRTDVQLYRSFAASDGLGAAWVTNGFETLKIEARELRELSAVGED